MKIELNDTGSVLRDTSKKIFLFLITKRDVTKIVLFLLPFLCFLLYIYFFIFKGNYLLTEDVILEKCILCVANKIFILELIFFRYRDEYYENFLKVIELTYLPTGFKLNR